MIDHKELIDDEIYFTFAVGKDNQQNEFQIVVSNERNDIEVGSVIFIQDHALVIFYLSNTPPRIIEYLQYHFNQYHGRKERFLIYVDYMISKYILSFRRNPYFSVLEITLSENEIDDFELKHNFVKKWINAEKVRLHEYPEEEVISKQERIKAGLINRGFLNLDLVKNLSDSQLEDLLEKIIFSDLPYQIAMVDYLGFVIHLYKEHFKTKGKMYNYLSSFLDESNRSLKGNILILNPKSGENNKRYTSYLFKEQVKKDYQKVILGH